MASATWSQALGGAPGASRPQGFIVSPIYDVFFFILSPLLALAMGVALGGTALADRTVPALGQSASGFFIGAFTSAHLFIVFFRSHANRDIFSTHPYRFTVVPVVLFLAVALSPWIRVAAATVAVFWDVYHSGLQTFGLGRIYDRLRGNDAHEGRTLDLALNHLLYAGPILAGATFLAHVHAFYKFESVGSAFFTSIPAAARSWHATLAMAVIGLGIPFLVAYVAAYARLARRGYRVSPQKVALLVSTALCSIYAWGFNSFGQAFFVMNFFHALQYFALVGHTERKSIAARLRLSPARFLAAKIALILLATGFGFGIMTELNRPGPGASTALLCLGITVSLLHFWYDGFIWSVRKKQV